ncbi:YopT-type cysteine protease domain-containing protein [Xylophilus ampelinus]|uniref:YopT-type cysteine protease-like protein n=1 Tax=Xylophilus ampelinus TaxID=54067 RepID=A0A318SKH9_9BURK|nr:YopT-type cysteine protease domain-containing protein [Xylophilus ampelinus]MCS4511004.1 YopT-type cysteine protease domain-containing protein [Xylophilus ampelinus]PYE76002.1 YopT-type cysteine protease-like protein [Xylophilus ampelinus]
MDDCILGSLSTAHPVGYPLDGPVLDLSAQVPGASESAPGALRSFPKLSQALPALGLAIVPRGRSRIGILPDKTGGCASKPYADSSSSASSSSSPGSPARHSTSVFDYRTDELAGANVHGICVGLTAQWLLGLGNGASDRMTALMPERENHAVAAAQQQHYQDLKRSLRHQGATSAEADLRALNTMFHEAGLTPSEEVKKYEFGKPSSLSRLVKNITREDSKHLLSLYFAGGEAHTVATSASNGITTLFDPNYGEFTASSAEMTSLLQSLGNRYRYPNGQYLTTITTQTIS